MSFYKEMAFLGVPLTNVEVSFAKPYEATWQPELKDQVTFITVAHNVPADRQVRVVAVLLDGKEVGGENPQLTTGRVQQLTASFRGLAIKDIKAFRFQCREYQWAEFKNILLKPSAVLTDTPATQAAATQASSYGELSQLRG